MPESGSTAPFGDRAGEIWRVPKGASLLWQSWDQVEVIVFNRASGQTHLLDAFSAAVLQRIEAFPGRIADLRRYFASGLELEEEALSERLEVVCRRFEELGLAEPEAS